jgi:hypothetical protein
MERSIPVHPDRGWGTTQLTTAAAAILLLMLATAAPAAVVVEIGDAAAAPAASATLAVRLRTDGDPITGLQHDLVLPEGVSVGARPTRPERPDCRINPELMPGEAGASFYWTVDPSCAGVVCRRPAAEVITSRAYFPDDVTLYSCTLTIDAAVPTGRHPIECSFVSTSDANGMRLDASCAAGELTIDSNLPRPTPPPTVVAWTPTPTPTACGDCGPLLEIGAASGVAGERVEFPVTLRTGGHTISGVQVDIGFPAEAPIPPRIDRSPDCTLGDGLGGWSSVRFQPAADIAVGLPATAIRALLIQLEATGIHDGATVLTCSVEIAADAPVGRYPLSATALLASDPDGNPLALPGADGAIEVLRLQGQQPVTDGNAASSGAGACAIGDSGGAGAWILLPLLLALRRRPSASRLPGRR